MSRYGQQSGQTCRDFEWIVLFDSSTPERFRTRIADYKSNCPQLSPVFVEPEKGYCFAEIFRIEIVKRLKAERVLSTYLVNDDALNVRFVEEIQQRAKTISDGTFINYNDGYQYYSENNYLMRINYPTNHFVSVVEKGDPYSTRGIFGYGGHARIWKIKDVRIENIKNLPMWCEVIHGKNMINDAYFLKAKMVNDADVFRRDFAVNEEVHSGFGVYVFRFFPRYARTFVRRAKWRLFGREW